MFNLPVYGYFYVCFVHENGSFVMVGIINFVELNFLPR